jgi:hypothetical protein
MAEWAPSLGPVWGTSRSPCGSLRLGTTASGFKVNAGLLAKARSFTCLSRPSVSRSRGRRRLAASHSSGTRVSASHVKLLLIAEAPPAALDRYFYFEDVPNQDSVFRYVARSILDVEPTRQNKPALLAGMRETGVFLIDVQTAPLDGTPLTASVPGLVKRALALAPTKVILIKATV